MLAFSILFVLLISLALAAAGFAIYRYDMIARYQNYAGDAIDFIARCVDGDDMEECINTGRKSEQYEKLQILANDFKETHDLEYIYIIKPLKKNPSLWQRERNGKGSRYLWKIRSTEIR